MTSPAPAAHQTQTQFVSHWVPRLIAFLLIGGGSIVVAIGVDKANLVEPASYIIAAALGFTLQRYIPRDPANLPIAVAPVVGGMLTAREQLSDFLRMRKGDVGEDGFRDEEEGRSLLRIFAVGVPYGAVLYFAKVVIASVLDSVFNLWIIGGIVALLAALFTAPEMFVMAREWSDASRKRREARKARPRPKPQPKPNTGKPTPATSSKHDEPAEPVILRLRVPAGQVQPGPLDAKTAQHGVNTAALAADLNTATADMEGRVPVAITITPGGAYSVEVITTEPQPQYPSRRAMRQTAQEGAA